MFKRFVALLLICLMVTANFTRLFIYAGFEVNKNYIAQKLCENRNKPWLHCNGRCYLAKKIKQAEEKERSTERQIQKSLVQDACIAEGFELKFYARLLQSFTGHCPNMVPVQVNQFLLRPPQFA